MFCREGKQEGALKGFNPRRKGRHSHHPLLAVLAEAPFILHGWLRSGNTGAARGIGPFLQEALALLPEGMWLRTVRADCGFFDETLLEFLEQRGLARGRVPVRGGAGGEGPRRGGQTLRGLGRLAQTPAAGGGHVALAPHRVAEVDPARGPPGHRRGPDLILQGAALPKLLALLRNSG